VTVIRRVFRTDRAEAVWEEAEKAFAVGDAVTALRIFSGLAERGEWLAYVEIGNLLEMGTGGVTKDLDGALHWYRKAIFESDDPNAHFAMARLYWNGKDLSKDFERASHHAQKALGAQKPYNLAEHYRPMAYVMLGTMYSEGLGVPKNIEKARAVLKEGATAGFIWPMFELSKLELRCWHFVTALKLRLEAASLGGRIYARDPNDVRLIGTNLLHVKKQWNS